MIGPHAGRNALKLTSSASSSSSPSQGSLPSLPSSVSSLIATWSCGSVNKQRYVILHQNIAPVEFHLEVEYW